MLPRVVIGSLVWPWGINSVRWRGVGVSSAVKLGASGCVDARSDERRCARTGPPRQLIWGTLVSTDATPVAASGCQRCPTGCPVFSAAPCAARVAGGWCWAWSGGGGRTRLLLLGAGK